MITTTTVPHECIVHFIMHCYEKKVKKFHQYQQNIKSLNTKKTVTYDARNPGSGLR
jgi:hypothetical protein